MISFTKPGYGTQNHSFHSETFENNDNIMYNYNYNYNDFLGLSPSPAQQRVFKKTNIRNKKNKMKEQKTDVHRNYKDAQPYCWNKTLIKCIMAENKTG